MTSFPTPGNAFGATFRQPGAEDGFSVGFRTALNLLAKARRALLAGDDERAARYVDKAAAIPWDDHEQHVPGISAAEFALYLSISDDMEACDGDGGWIDGPAAAIESDAPGRREVASALRDLALGEELTDIEARRVDALLAACPPLPMNYTEGDVDQARRVERISTLVRAWVDVGAV